MSVLRPLMNLDDNALRSFFWPDSLAAREYPSFQFHETDGGYVATIDMPGINSKDLKLEAEGHELVIVAERKKRDFDHNGITSRKYTRRLTIPENVDRDKIEAHCEDGVLTLALPKFEESKARKIEIKTGQEATKGWKGLFGPKGN